MDHGIDSETFQLIIDLQSNDVQHLLRGKHRVGEAPDSELAMQLFEDELKSIETFHSDRIMSRSIAQAVVNDAQLIQEIISDEEQITKDREYAVGLDTGVPYELGEGEALGCSSDRIDEEMLGKLTALYIGDGHASQTSAHAGSSSQGGAASKERNVLKRRCTACLEEVAYIDAIRCPCGHDYCRHCMTALFEMAIGDESLFPARCCRQPIPLGLNQIFLPADLMGRYRAKQQEHGTPNRTYCHERTCATFIPAQFIVGNKAVCVKCGSSTCTLCKGPLHESDCPPDAITMTVLRLAKAEGWMRCFSCRTMVELNTGCNHISK